MSEDASDDKSNKYQPGGAGQRRRRRPGEHWKYTLPLGCLAGYFSLRLVASLLTTTRSNSSIMFNAGVAAFSLMMAYLIYVKYTQEARAEGDN